MSLFPAYAEASPATPSASTSSGNYEQKSWLENSSFIPFSTEEIQEKDEDVETRKQSYSSSGDDDDNDKIDDEDKIKVSHKTSRKKHKIKHKKHKKEKKHSKEDRETDAVSAGTSMVFTGSEEYYVDKDPTRGYLAVNTLYKPACPKYRVKTSVLGYREYRKVKVKKRYYKAFSKRDLEAEERERNEQIYSLSEEEFTSKNRDFNVQLARQPKNVNVWIEYVNHQEASPMKLTKTQLAERKLEIIEKALIHNFGDEKLYKIYVEIINSTYPSFEISKYLDLLLAKDPTNYLLWTAHIFATQGSMARCTVPDVMKLYENCMQKMYRKCQSDEIMLKLFTSCALFLRQAGLMERFFALIKLALELNFSNDQFKTIQPFESDQKLLIDYEEVILKSGLPMNEIWLRIEKLRQNFNFLPCPATSDKSSDPQRIILNEDICYLIYPLALKENCFPLIIIILRLLKIPLISNSVFHSQFLFNYENSWEFDSIEDLLILILNRTTDFHSFKGSPDTDRKEENSTSIKDDFNLLLFDFVKGIVNGPSYISTNIGYEIYLNTILNILLICSECYKDDERKRTIFVLIWLRFKRILLILEKFSNKLTPDYVKKLKTEIKQLLKKEENRNVLNFYTEYALIEQELGNSQQAEMILRTSITNGESNVPKADFCSSYLTYAEILLKENNLKKALKILASYALNIQFDSDENFLNESNDQKFTEATKLRALKQLTQKLNDLIFIEKNVEIMDVEQFFLPDYFVNLLKMKCYYQTLLNGKLEAMAFIENTLRHFTDKNVRHCYIRENIYEFYIKLMQWPADKTCYISNLLLYETVQRAIKEFPDNLFFLKACASLQGQLWHKIRSLLMENVTPLKVIFLIIAAQYRYKLHAIEDSSREFLSISDDIDCGYKIRVYNVLRMVTSKSNNSVRKNSLIWRLLLRSLCDLQSSFEKTKNILYTALDECPWNKALYLDGSVFVPQELAQLQDLILEKELRIYALPEELEILREDTFESGSVASTK